MIDGYARVSTDGWSVDALTKGLRAAGAGFRSLADAQADTTIALSPLSPRDKIARKVWNSRCGPLIRNGRAVMTSVVARARSAARRRNLERNEPP